MPYKFKQGIRKRSSDVVKLFLEPSSPTKERKIPKWELASEIAGAVLKAVQPLFNGMQLEIEALREEVKQLKHVLKDAPKETVLPDEASKNLDEFIKFEKDVQDKKEIFDAFQTELKSVATQPNFVKNCWRKLFVVSLAEKSSWKGIEEKRNVRTAIAIRNATIVLGRNEEEFMRSTKSFFQYAKNRQVQRQAYKRKISETE